MADDAPAVRAVAASAICKLLNQYWEMLPSATISLYIQRLTDQLAFDAAAPAVRVAVLEGLSLLIDNTHAQVRVAGYVSCVRILCACARKQGACGYAVTHSPSSCPLPGAPRRAHGGARACIVGASPAVGCSASMAPAA